MRMGKNKHNNIMQHQLVIEEYQETRPEITVTIKAHQDTETEEDVGTLPGCICIYNQPEQGYVCSTCYYQKLCKETSTPTHSHNDTKITCLLMIKS